MAKNRGGGQASLRKKEKTNGLVENKSGDRASQTKEKRENE